MKCLIRMYHERGMDLIFYENAAAPHRKRHATIEAVPLPLEQGELAPAFFKVCPTTLLHLQSVLNKIIGIFSFSGRRMVSAQKNNRHSLAFQEKLREASI